MSIKTLVRPLVLSLASIWGSDLAVLAQNKAAAPPLPQRRNQAQELASPDQTPSSEEQEFQKELENNYREFFPKLSLNLQRKIAALTTAHREVRPFLEQVSQSYSLEQDAREDFSQLSKALRVLAYLDKEINLDLDQNSNLSNRLEHNAQRLEHLSQSYRQWIDLCDKHQFGQIKSYIEALFRSSLNALEEGINRNLASEETNLNLVEQLESFNTKIILEDIGRTLKLQSNFDDWLKVENVQTLTDKLNQNLVTQLQETSFKQDPELYAISSEALYRCLVKLEELNLENPLCICSSDVQLGTKALFDPMLTELFNQFKIATEQNDTNSTQKLMYELAHFGEYYYYLHFIQTDYTERLLNTFHSIPLIQELISTQLDPNLTDSDRNNFLSQHQEQINALLSNHNSYSRFSGYLVSKLLNKVHQDFYNQHEAQLLKTGSNFNSINQHLSRLNQLKLYLQDLCGGRLPKWESIEAKYSTLVARSPQLISAAKDKASLRQALKDTNTLRKFLIECSPFKRETRRSMNIKDTLLIMDTISNSKKKEKKLLQQLCTGKIKLNSDNLELAQIYQGLSLQLFHILYGGTKAITKIQTPIPLPKLEHQDAQTKIELAIKLKAPLDLKLQLLIQIVRSADADLNPNSLEELKAYMSEIFFNLPQSSEENFTGLLHALIQGQDSKTIFEGFDENLKQTIQEALGLNLTDRNQYFVASLDSGRLQRDLNQVLSSLPTNMLNPSAIGQLEPKNQSKARLNNGLEIAEEYLKLACSSVQVSAQIGKLASYSFENSMKHYELQARAYKIARELMSKLKVSGEYQQDPELRNDFFESLQSCLSNPESFRYLSPNMYGLVLADWLEWIQDTATGSIHNPKYMVSKNEMENIIATFKLFILEPGVLSAEALGPNYEAAQANLQLDLSQIPKLQKIKRAYPQFTDHQILVANQIASSPNYNNQLETLQELGFFSGQYQFLSLIDHLHRAQIGHNE